VNAAGLGLNRVYGIHSNETSFSRNDPDTDSDDPCHPKEYALGAPDWKNLIAKNLEFARETSYAFITISFCLASNIYNCLCTMPTPVWWA